MKIHKNKTIRTNTHIYQCFNNSNEYNIQLCIHAYILLNTLKIAKIQYKTNKMYKNRDKMYFHCNLNIFYTANNTKIAKCQTSSQHVVICENNAIHFLHHETTRIVWNKISLRKSSVDLSI